MLNPFKKTWTHIINDESTENAWPGAKGETGRGRQRWSWHVVLVKLNQCDNYGEVCVSRHLKFVKAAAKSGSNLF